MAGEVVQKSCPRWTAAQVKKRLPIVEWLPKYKWREDFLPDFTSGFTLACIHIPQGLAFAYLSNVDPIMGIYTGCFSTFIYTLLGTAHISSFGPTAVTSMMLGEVISGYHEETKANNNDTAIALTFCIGIFYAAAFFFQLGIMTSIFVKPYTSGFIAGSSVHIIVKNIKLLLGVNAKTFYGILNLYYNTVDVGSKIGQTHIPTLIHSLVVIAILVFNQAFLKRFLSKYTKFIVPMEAVVMIVSTGLSYGFQFNNMGIRVVGDVPTGFPTPHPPPMDLVNDMWLPSLVIALVNYSLSSAMTLAFNKEASPNQDLLALGFANICCCSLQCITIGNSMMRTTIVATLGVKTLMASIVSSFFLLFVLLFAGPLFSPLPYCVLGCIIMVGAGMLLIARLKEVRAIVRSSKEDTLIWGASLLGVLVLDVTYGLMIGGVLSLRKILAEREREKKLKEEAEREKGEEEEGLMRLKEVKTDTTQRTEGERRRHSKI